MNSEEVEIWRQVPSLPEYEASSLGRIRVIPYRAVMWNGGVRTYGGVAWPGAWSGKRYTFRFRGRTYKVARVVCEAFNGPPPSAKSVCMHDDEDASNNRPENLVWGTQKQNLNYPGIKAYHRRVAPMKFGHHA